MKLQRLALITVLLLVAFGMASHFHAVEAGSRSPKHELPALSVKTLSGKSLKLQDFKGQPLVVDFWATWCGPCRFAMPHLNEVQARYDKSGLVVLGLSVDEIEPRRVQRFADRLGVKFQLAMANDQVLRHYGPIRALPTTFFVNREGEVVRRVVGYIDEETLDAYVQEIVQK